MLKLNFDSLIVISWIIHGSYIIYISDKRDTFSVNPTLIIHFKVEHILFNTCKYSSQYKCYKNPLTAINQFAWDRIGSKVWVSWSPKSKWRISFKYPSTVLSVIPYNSTVSINTKLVKLHIQISLKVKKLVILQ